MHEVVLLCDQGLKISLVRLLTHIQLSLGGIFDKTELQCSLAFDSAQQALHWRHRPLSRSLGAFNIWLEVETFLRLQWLGKLSFILVPALVLVAVLVGAFAAKTYDSGATSYLAP